MIELWSPGLVGPGIFGVIMLIAGFFALGPLDTNPAGIALIVLAVVLFAVEIFVAGFGVFGIGGIVALIIGGLILISDTSIDAEEVSVWALAVVGGAAAVIVGGLGLLLAIDRRKPKWVPSGSGATIVGHEGVAHTPVSGSGTVVIDSELWSARAASGRIPRNTPVRVVEMNGLTVVVEPTVPLELIDEEALGDGAVRSR